VYKASPQQVTIQVSKPSPASSLLKTNNA